MNKRLIRLLPVLLILLSCSVAPMPSVPVVDPGATLHLFLQPPPQEAQDLTLTISSLNARRSDGQEFALLNEPLILVPAQRLGRQTKLLVQKLPLGEYFGLKMVITKATLETEDGKTDLLTETDSQLIEEKFFIEANRAQALFLSLSQDRLVTAGYRLSAKFALWKPQPPLSELKGLISHPRAGTLTFFEKKTPAIFSVLAVGRQPADIALDQRLMRAYVALTDENSIAAVDLVQQKVERKLPLRPADRAQELDLSSDGRTLLVTNPGSNSVSIIATGSFTERGRVQLSSRPASSFISTNDNFAYVVLPEVNALEVLDLSRVTLLARAVFAETPFKGVTSRDGRYLYLLTEDSPYLLVVDAQNLTVNNKVFIGYGARCLVVNSNNGLLYVGLDNGEIAVVDRQVDLPIDYFRAGGQVVAIVPDLIENSLFVLTGNRQQLEKYDLVSKKRLAVLDFDADSYGLAVMGEK